MIEADINKMALEIYDWCQEKGWNENLDFPKMLMNLHSEITEAWEEIRNGHEIDEVYYSAGDKPEGVPIEIADLVIRILHIAAWRNWDLAWLVNEKMKYNKTRPYRHGGKTA